MTLCDLVADHRAPTPSAAAEAAVPLMASEEQRVRALATRLVSVIRRRLDRAGVGLSSAASIARRAVTRITERRRAAIAALAGRVEALSPLGTLARGFAVARGLDGGTLSGAGDFVVGEAFDLVVRDGVVGAVTTEVRPPTWPTDSQDRAASKQRRALAGPEEHS